MPIDAQTEDLSWYSTKLLKRGLGSLLQLNHDSKLMLPWAKDTVGLWGSVVCFKALIRCNPPNSLVWESTSPYTYLINVIPTYLQLTLVN